MFSNGGASPNQGKRPHVYQIDFTAVASGKRIASSKRRVRWRFGFANLEALEAGQTGTDCRGEEHDVTIVWSITSGKRLVLADGKEVHYSHSRNNVFDFSWTMRGNHVLKVVAHAQPPMSAQPGFRQYDFFVDGQSFFTFPKVFRLGLAPNDPRAGPGPAGGSVGGAGRRRQQGQVQQNNNNNNNMAERSIVPASDYNNNNNNNNNNNGYNNYAGPGGGSSDSRNANLTPYTNGGGGGGGGFGDVRSVSSKNNIVSIEAPHNPEEEDAYLRQAIENSLKEAPSPNANANRPSINNGGMAGAGVAADTLLLDFMAPPPSAPVSTGPGPALALPPSTSQYPNEMFGAPSPAAQQQQHAFAALPPSTTANAFPPQQQQQQQQQMVAVEAADPWGMAAVAAALPPSHHAVAQPPPNQYGAAQASLSAQPTYGGDPFGGAAPPTPVAATNPYGAAPAPFGSPPPSSIAGPPQEEYTPATQASSIGFSSPMAQPFRPQEQFQQQPQQLQLGEQQEQQQAPEPAAPTPHSDPALLSMNVLSGQPQSLVTESMTNGTNGAAAGSMADQAYAKLVNMDAFDLVQDKDTESRKNPFDAASTTTSTTIGGHVSNNNANASLADMRKTKKPTDAKKSVMNTPAPAPGALVLSNNQQQGNFGGYGGQYNNNMGAGMGTMGAMGTMGQQQQQPTMGMMGGMGTMGGQPPPQMQGYGGMQQQAYGQPPPAQQGYGMQSQAPAPPMQQQQQQQPSYGMPPQQQAQYGQPPQQQPYGQQPPPMQQPFGF